MGLASECAHKDYHKVVRSIMCQDPYLSRGDAVSMTRDIKNKHLYRPTGITPYAYEFARPPATFLATSLSEAPLPPPTQMPPPPFPSPFKINLLSATPSANKPMNIASTTNKSTITR
ncbi:hypothetical protein CYMTET_2799 [Cymbomonas tetramitiformis]|uniref:Uncharacterized protein n=1 Tax=Cymbomonas tetramitiformis TaxID=36881 RepID=A0AAE0H4D2_9CHLO|nr:hypothetical protein CYMTET_2799 [Cymbomonas tetramitiformis]